MQAATNNMANGVPIIGESFGDVGRQIGYWDARNLNVIEANMQRRAQAEQLRNSWFANVANIERAEDEKRYNRALQERQREDILEADRRTREFEAYRFGEGQRSDRERTQAAIEEAALNRHANTRQNEFRVAEAERGNRFKTVADEIDAGRPLAEFDTSGFSPTEIQALRNAETRYAEDLAGTASRATEASRYLNAEITKRRRSLAVKRMQEDGEDLDDAEAIAAKLGPEALPLIPDEELPGVFKALGFKMDVLEDLGYNAGTQQFAPKKGMRAAGPGEPGEGYFGRLRMAEGSTSPPSTVRPTGGGGGGWSGFLAGAAASVAPSIAPYFVGGGNGTPGGPLPARPAPAPPQIENPLAALEGKMIKQGSTVYMIRNGVAIPVE